MNISTEHYLRDRRRVLGTRRFVVSLKGAITSARHPLRAALLCSTAIAGSLGAMPTTAATITIDNGAEKTVDASTVPPLTAVADRLNIGLNSTGTLVINGGGVVSNATSYLGVNAGSSGTATVSNGGTWSSTGTFVVGNSGAGILNIDNGSVSAKSMTIGNNVSGAGAVTVSGQTGKLAVTDGLAIANNGAGSLTISNGGVVTSGWGYVGDNAAGAGTVVVTGADSLWSLRSYLGLGGDGAATMLISDGGRVQNGGEAELAITTSASASITVTGAESSWSVGDYLLVGGNGSATMTIADGGTVTSDAAYIGYDMNGSRPGSDKPVHGFVTVTGAGSSWTSASSMNVGDSTHGVLHILDGGVVNSAQGAVGINRFGSELTKGDVVVDGAGSAWNIGADGLYVGILEGSAGTLAISNDGAVNAQGEVIIAQETGSFGRIAIGAGEGMAATGAGTLDTAEVTFGAGDGGLIFNHTDADYLFDATITSLDPDAAGTVKVLSGTTIVTGNSSYYGSTLVDAGTLRAGGASVFSANSDYAIAAGGLLDLDGYSQTVLGLTNAGAISIGSANSTAPVGARLVVTGDYVGNDGTVVLRSALGADASPTDQLVIDGGTATGTTNLVVLNTGGMGAQTTGDGIRVVDAINGASTDALAFRLAGDFVTSDGQQAVVGGAYAYTLHHNGTIDATDSDWYLRSQLSNPVDPTDPVIPLYNPGAPIYESYPQVLAAMNRVPTLNQRVGDRLHNEVTADRATWGRIDVGHGKFTPNQSSAGASRELDQFGLQAGTDFLLHQTEAGDRLVGGLSLRYGQGAAEISSPHGDGTIDTTGYGLGGTLTWYGADGFYLDGQAQLNWFDSDLASTSAGQGLVANNGGMGAVASLEAGKSIDMGDGLSVTPQMQLSYSEVWFDAFDDAFNNGAHVSLDKSGSLQARIGVSVDKETTWKSETGSTNRARVYANANLHQELLDGSRVSVSGVPFSQQDERTRVSVGLGASLDLEDGKVGIFGSVNADTGLDTFGQSYNLTGKVGLKLRF